MKGILTIMALVAVLFVSVQYVEAEEIHGFYGLDDLFKDPNSIVKLYKSGGFSIKNYDMGIAIYAHPVSKTEMTKFTVIESNGKVSRFLIGTEPLSDKDITVPSPVNSTRIEPKSSIGADITKYDVPTLERYEPSDEIKILIKYQEAHNIFLNEEYVPTIQIKNENMLSQSVPDVGVTVEISRDDNKVRTITGTTSQTGKWNPVVAMTYPTFYPGFCYDVTITATFGNQTAIETDDFLVVTDQKYWEYGEEYSLGRDKIEEDYDCNE